MEINIFSIFLLTLIVICLIIILIMLNTKLTKSYIYNKSLSQCTNGNILPINYSVSDEYFELYILIPSIIYKYDYVLNNIIGYYNNNYVYGYVYEYSNKSISIIFNSTAYNNITVNENNLIPDETIPEFKTIKECKIWFIFNAKYKDYIKYFSSYLNYEEIKLYACGTIASVYAHYLYLYLHNYEYEYIGDIIDVKYFNAIPVFNSNSKRPIFYIQDKTKYNTKIYNNIILFNNDYICEDNLNSYYSYLTSL